MTFVQSENLRNPELLTYHTLMVPAQNELLRAGCSITTKLYDTRIQTSAHMTGKNELKCVKNRIAYEWISICAKTENNKFFDDAAKELMQNILTLATKDVDMHKVFVVAQTRMFKHKEQGIILLRLTTNYRHLEEQMVRMITLCNN
jgi:hypothetical protein